MFLQNKNEENRKLFCKQKNNCVLLLRKSKKDSFANLNERNITDNKRFWKTPEHFLTKKIPFPERKDLTEEGSNSLLRNCEKVAKELNNLFANTVKNLNIPNYENCNFLAENIDNPTLKAIVKCRNLSSISMELEYKSKANFSFNFVSKEHVLAEIKSWMSRRLFRRAKFRLKLLRQMKIFFQKQFAFILTNR